MYNEIKETAMKLQEHLEEIKKYIEEGLTQKEMAKILGVSAPAVHFFFQKNGLYTKRKSKARPIKEYVKQYQRKQRIEIIAIMGGKCARCGFSDIRALQIDHINGGGTKENKSIEVGGIQKKIKSNPLLINTEYQLLCANCNWIKKSENKEIRK